MNLNEESLKETSLWTSLGYEVPCFNRESMIIHTKENPVWVHFGGGNLFRAYHCQISQKLLNEGIMKSGITVVDREIIEKLYRPNNNLSIAVTLKSDGSIKKTIIGSIGESCLLDSDNKNEFERLKEIFRKDSLQLATFTITEKGYALTDSNNELLNEIEKDYKEGPSCPQSYLGKVSALLYERYLSGKKPIAMVSTDNCSHNGDKLYKTISSFAKQWVENQFVEKGFLEYINSDRVSFPWTMIDKITPHPDEKVKQILLKDGLEDLDPIITSKKSYVSKFVNAEETQYLVIEDDFPNGRPALEKTGVFFTDRETVEKVETMKVGTCLNPLHTCLAVFGCLLGYTKIADEMSDPDLHKMVEILGYQEGLMVVTDPKIIDPKAFIDTCINVRFPNPFMPDSPQRIATDTSQKLAVRYGTTISKYLDRKIDLNNLKVIPMVYAGWIRYLTGIDDNSNHYELSPDPLLDELLPYVDGLNKENVEEKIGPLLHNKTIFRYDLYEIGLASQVIENVRRMLLGNGSIRTRIKEIIA